MHAQCVHRLVLLLVIGIAIYAVHCREVHQDHQRRRIPPRCRQAPMTPVSCAQVGRDSLLPHPEDCELFYYCISPRAKPICRQCPAHLHFNPRLHVCDYPTVAGCRVHNPTDSPTDRTTLETSTPDVLTTEASTPEVATTEGPTMEASTPEVATTVGPTMEASTPEVATTEGSTTEASTPEVATTEGPTTEASTPGVATSQTPTTEASTSEVATTAGLTTEETTSEVATTEAVTQEVATTEASTSVM